jgi:hypothetical protein
MMKNVKRTMIISLIAVFLSNVATAADHAKLIGKVGLAGEVALLGGLASASSGAGGSALMIVQSGAALVLSVFVTQTVDLSSSSAQEQLKQVGALLLKETDAYHANGEVGVLLAAGLKSVLAANPDVSQDEAVDLLTTAAQNTQI